jgi:hypothetical protein
MPDLALWSQHNGLWMWPSAAGGQRYKSRSHSMVSSYFWGPNIPSHPSGYIVSRKLNNPGKPNDQPKFDKELSSCLNICLRDHLGLHSTLDFTSRTTITSSRCQSWHWNRHSNCRFSHHSGHSLHLPPSLGEETYNASFGAR